MPIQDARAWSQLPSTVRLPVLSSLPVFPSDGPLHGQHRAPACKEASPCPHAENSSQAGARTPCRSLTRFSPRAPMPAEGRTSGGGPGLILPMHRLLGARSRVVGDRTQQQTEGVCGGRGSRPGLGGWVLRNTAAVSGTDALYHTRVRARTQTHTGAHTRTVPRQPRYGSKSHRDRHPHAGTHRWT